MKQALEVIARGIFYPTPISRARAVEFIRSERNKGSRVYRENGGLSVDCGGAGHFHFRKVATVVETGTGRRCPGCGASTRLWTGYTLPDACIGVHVFEAGDCQCNYAVRNGQWCFYAGGIARA